MILSQKTKVCLICGDKKPLTAFPEYKDRHKESKKHPYCRTCKSRYETLKRYEGFLRALREEQCEDVGFDEALVGHYTVNPDGLYYSPSNHHLIIAGKTPADDEHIELTDDERRRIIVALGGICVEDFLPPRQDMTTFKEVMAHLKLAKLYKVAKDLQAQLGIVRAQIRNKEMVRNE